MEKSSCILITGAKGFLGKNLRLSLAARGYENLLCYDIDNTTAELEAFAAKADFVFHLAGVNRPKDPSEFYDGNSDLTVKLCSLLERTGRKVPMVLTSLVLV